MQEKQRGRRAKLENKDFLGEKCKNCSSKNSNVKIISYNNLKGGINKHIPHRSDLCVKCLKGYPCLLAG